MVWAFELPKKDKRNCPALDILVDTKYDWGIGARLELLHPKLIIWFAIGFIAIYWKYITTSEAINIVSEATNVKEA